MVKIPSPEALKRRLIDKRQIVKQRFDLIKHGETVQGKMCLTIPKHLLSIDNIRI